MSGHERDSKRSLKLAALLAYFAAAGHPSLAPTWHRPIWVGRARPRAPMRLTPLALVPSKPEKRRSRRAHRPILSRVTR